METTPEQSTQSYSSNQQVVYSQFYMHFYRL